MDEMISSIGCAAENMSKLMNRLSKAAAPDAARIVEQVLKGEMMNHFTITVDAMRHLLWVYILAAGQVTKGDLEDPVQGVQLKRATIMLMKLREEMILPSRHSPEGNSFYDQVEALGRYYSKQANLPSENICTSKQPQQQPHKFSTVNEPMIALCS